MNADRPLAHFTTEQIDQMAAKIAEIEREAELAGRDCDTEFSLDEVLAEQRHRAKQAREESEKAAEAEWMVGQVVTRKIARRGYSQFLCIGTGRKPGTIRARRIASARRDAYVQKTIQVLDLSEVHLSAWGGFLSGEEYREAMATA